MTNPTKNPDITIRGGLINVDDLTSPTQPPRHQPDTPRTKKRTATRSDHIPAPTKTKTPTAQPHTEPAEVTENGTTTLS